MSSCNFGCPRNFPQPIISKLDSMQSYHKISSPSRVSLIGFHNKTVASKVCNFQTNCRDGSDEGKCAKSRCTFDSGDFWNWYVANPTRKKRAVSYTWLAQQGSTGTSGTGPTVDHTSGIKASRTPAIRSHLNQIQRPAVFAG